MANEQVYAGALALLVHVLFVSMLMLGVSWKNMPETPVYANLWTALPEPPKPVEPLPELPPPNPPAVPKPEPVKLKIDPDIALKKKAVKDAEQKRQEALKAEVAERKRQAKLKEDEARKRKQDAERKRREADQRRELEEDMQRAEREHLKQEEKQLQARRDKERKEAEAKRATQEKARRDLDALMEAELAGDLEAEAHGLRQQGIVTARLKRVEEFKLRIQAKIKGLLIYPPGLRGRPEAVYHVDLLPNGEVIRATLVSSSGQPTYDRAVESAILKASPLPLPPERDVAAAFRDGLELKFRPD